MILRDFAPRTPWPVRPSLCTIDLLIRPRPAPMRRLRLYGDQVAAIIHDPRRHTILSDTRVRDRVSGAARRNRHQMCYNSPVTQPARNANRQ